MRFVSFDVGVRNLGVVAGHCEELLLVVELAEVWDLGTLRGLPERLHGLLRERVVPLAPAVAYVEAQPPIGRTHVVRKNSFVEGALAASCVSLGMHWEPVHPAAVKRFFGCGAGRHGANKARAVATVRSFCPNLPYAFDSSHICDAVLNAMFKLARAQAALSLVFDTGRAQREEKDV